MDEGKSFKKFSLAALIAVFILCIVLIIVVNSRTQTAIFWDNQQKALVLITEDCASQINGWASMQEAFTRNLAGDMVSGNFTTYESRERHMADVVARNPEIKSAYLGLDNGEYADNFTSAEKVEFLHADWYLDGKAAGGRPVFTEPYMDVLTRELVVSCVQAVTLPGGISGVVGLDVSLAELTDKVNSLHPSPHGGAYLVSPRGKVMTYIDQTFLPKVVSGRAMFLGAGEVLAKVDVLEKIDKYQDRGVSIELIKDYDGAEKYEAVTTLPGTGWVLGVNIPLSDYDDAVRQVIRRQLPIVFLALFMSAISLVIAFILIRNAKVQHELQNDIAVARAASRTKSDFLSRMSHEMRTPMNAIIGMAKIAESTDDLSKLRHCLETIDVSAGHLLGIINDVLDMSKIEAGKFELDFAPLNLEKMLMRICNLVVDKTDQKNQSLKVNLGPDMGLHYLGDELRLSQVITNLLSNAVKFTPDNGSITLSVREADRGEDVRRLHFTVSDTGIGMSEEQMSRLFKSFEQADGSTSRRFGGTGLGLAISRNIVEKMNGAIWAESEEGRGSSFHFEVSLKRAPREKEGIIFNGISPADVQVLVVDGDLDIREHFKAVTGHFGVRSHEADSARRAIELVERARDSQTPYDVIFLDYNLPDTDALEMVRSLNDRIDKNTVIIMTSFLEWDRIENLAAGLGVNRFISKPLFPSAILDSISEVIGRTAKALDLTVEASDNGGVADLSQVSLLFVEDVEINREIFTSLLEPTGVRIDEAANGLIAVEKFKANPGKYDMVIMDIQMPEMDGYEATQTIRGLGTPEAQTIPIIAMTANVFKEDIDRCLAAGMNDHLPKPIDERAVIEKILFYAGKR